MDKFPSAAFKKFASEKDAWAFVKGAEASAAPELCRGEPPSSVFHLPNILSDSFHGFSFSDGGLRS